MKRGYGLGSVWPSRKREFDVPGTGGQEKFIVNNFDNSYAGARDLGSALTFSDNAVFAAVGIATGTKRIARLIERMGVRTPVSSNPAMTLGAFKQGVSVLDWAHAYETLRDRRQARLGHARRAGQRARSASATCTRSRPTDARSRATASKTKRVLSADARGADDAADADRRLAAAPASARPTAGFAAGKTGTTEDFGDAWFVGFTARADDRRLGRLPRQAHADEDRVRRRAGRRRHLPGADLARLRRPGRRDPQAARSPSGRPSATARRRRTRPTRRAELSDPGHRRLRRPATAPGTGGDTGARRQADSPGRRHRRRRRRRAANARADARRRPPHPTPTPAPTPDARAPRRRRTAAAAAASRPAASRAPSG